MGLPLLFAAPTSPDEWRAWSFNHAADHYGVISDIARLKTENLTQYLLDPMDPTDLGMWFYEHQLMHNEANAVLGTQGYDLLSFDWQDPDQLAEWLQLNGSEHQSWDTAINAL